MVSLSRLALQLATRLSLGLALAGLGGCASFAMTALGVGASAGVTHTAGAEAARTFTAPAPRVKAASLEALQKMGILVAAIEPIDNGEVIRGSYADRRIAVEVEQMSQTTTQIRASAKHNYFVHDAATAKEIVEQTERAIAAAEAVPAAVPVSLPAAPATATTRQQKRSQPAPAGRVMRTVGTL